MNHDRFVTDDHAGIARYGIPKRPGTGGNEDNSSLFVRLRELNKTATTCRTVAFISAFLFAFGSDFAVKQTAPGTTRYGARGAVIAG